MPVLPDLSVRLFAPADYAAWAKWWGSHGELPEVPFDFLPEKGLVVLWKGVPACAGFLTGAGGSVCAIGNIAANPDIAPESRDKTLDLLFDALIRWAQDLKFTVMCGSTNITALEKRYLKHGFSITDRDVTHLGRKL